MREYYNNRYGNYDSLMGYVVLMGLVICMGGIGKYFSKENPRKDMKVAQVQQHAAESNLVQKVSGGKQ
ncbi:Uncharacterised protein [uncultured archaeon]|nr:Uncharacterised protein [uncultured archaeon]